MTLSELRDAYARGELTAPLMIDNDDVSLGGDYGVEAMFSMHPYDLLNAALDLLGIPHESV